MILNVKTEHVFELHEILCNIPFEESTLHDIEPPTERHPAVESLIKELEEGMYFGEEMES